MSKPLTLHLLLPSKEGREADDDLEQRQLRHQRHLFHAQLHSARSVPNCSNAAKMSSFSRRHPAAAGESAELESFTPFDPFADREVAREVAKPPPFYFESCSRFVPQSVFSSEMLIVVFILLEQVLIRITV